MIKFWAKVLKDHKIIKQTTAQNDVDRIDWSLFYDYMSALSRSMDLPSPIVIKAHIFDFAKFNFVKFTPSDFIEPVNFDQMVVELIKDK